MRPPNNTPPREATQVRPRRPGDPHIHVRTYPYGQEPLLWIYTLGRWRYAVVRARHACTGLVAYQVDINIDNHHPGNYSRTYRWNPACMRIIRRAEAWDDSKPGEVEYGPRTVQSQAR